jgi:hypothetical protein
MKVLVTGGTSGLGLAVTELLARVAGSSVTANCPCADQGGCHVDMVVGADHRGRGGVGVWRDPASPLTVRRQRPGHGWRSCWTRPTAWRPLSVDPGPVGAADHPALPGPPGWGMPPGLGSVLGGHREQLVVGMARGSASRSDVWCLFGLHPAVAPGTGAVPQGEAAGSLAGIGVRGRDVGGYPEDRRTVWRSP